MFRRRLRIGVLLIVCVPVLAYAGLRLYLASAWGRLKVEAELAQAIGAAVELGRVDSGLFSTALYDLRIHLSDDQTIPTVVIDELHLPVPLWKLLDEAVVLQNLQVNGLAITLRFDRSGRIRIDPPRGESRGTPPLKVRADNVRFTLMQEGKPDLRLNGIRASISTQDNQLTLKGHAIDPDWGEWSILGLVEPATGAAKLHLATKEVLVTQERLRALPFVADDIWAAFTVAGMTSVDFTLWHLHAEDDVHYRVAVEPRDADVHITSIDLQATQAAGRVVVEDGRVRLHDVIGQAAGGALSVQGDLDFRTQPARLRFDLAASAMDIRRLPASWDVPRFIEGTINGQARLSLELLSDGVRTSGQGKGQIVGARIGGAAASDPVSVRLSACDGGFRIQTASPATDSEIANAALETLRHVARPVTAAAAAWTDWRLRARTNAATPTYLRFHIDLKEVDLGRFLAGIGIPLAMPIEGLAAIDVHVDLPIDTLDKPQCYRLDGTVRLPYLKAAGLEFHHVAARLQYRDGVLRALDATGCAATGSFDGTATLGLAPIRDLDAQVRLTDMPLPQSLEMPGSLSGDLRLNAPLDRIGDPAAWQATARVDAAQLLVADRPLLLSAQAVQLRAGVLQAADVGGTLEGIPITANGTLALARPHAFTLHLGIHDADAVRLAELLGAPPPPVPLEGVVSGTTRVEGTLQPPRFKASGQTRSAWVEADQVVLRDLQADWQTDGQELRVDKIVARYGFGQVTGSASYSLTGAQPGVVTLQALEIDLGLLARQWGNRPGIEGRAFANLRADIGPMTPAGERPVTCLVEYQVPRVHVLAFAGNRLEGMARFDGQAWNYRCDGLLLGGRLHIEGGMANRLPISKLTVDGAQLDRLRFEVMQTTDVMPLHGRLDLELEHRGNRDSGPQASGRIWLRQLRWGANELADRLEADLQVRGNEVIVENAGGGFCRGLLSGRAVIDIGQPERSRVDLTLDRGEAQALLLPWTAIGPQVSGTVEARLQTTLGRPWRTTGMVALTRGQLFGVEVAEWRAPIDLAVSPGFTAGQLDIRESHAQVARGRVAADASWSWGQRSHLEGKLRFADVHLHELAPATAGINRLDGGKVSGRLDFNGDNVAGINDLTATLDATLKQTQVFEFPVFQQLAPYVAPQRSRRVPFETGDLKARLAQGVVHVEHLRLTGSVLQLLIQGQLSLQGRLDLDVTGSTGFNAIQSTVLRRLGLEIASAPIPQTALTRATSQLSARLVRLKVGGTVRNPSVQIVPLYQLTEEALRFFLTGVR